MKRPKHNRYHLLLSDDLDARVRRAAQERAVEPNDLIRSILSVALTGKDIPKAKPKDPRPRPAALPVPYIPPVIKKR